MKNKDKSRQYCKTLNSDNSVITKENLETHEL